MIQLKSVALTVLWGEGKWLMGEFSVRRWALAVQVMLLVLAVCVCPSASQPTGLQMMWLSEVKPGQSGRLLTVVKGRDISSIPVRVLSVIDLVGKPGSLILVKITDPSFVAREGGVAAGMSGSPLLIGGRIAGALGYGWEMADPSLGLITPIDELVQVLNGLVYPSPPPGGGPNPPPEPIPILSPSSVSGLRGPWAFDPRGFKPLRGLLSFSGLSDRSGREIASRLGFDPAEVLRVAGGSRSLPVLERASLPPGSAVGVQLCWGDVSLGATGTLSYVEGDGRFLAFAHPFLNRGEVSYPLTESFVHATVPSVRRPFKVGTPLHMVGETTLDRPEAIGGFLGRFPRALSVKMELEDEDRGVSSVKRFQVVSDPFLARVILPRALMGLMDDTWGRLGEGTAFVEVRVEGLGMDKAFERQNALFSESDISKEVAMDLGEVLDVLLFNRFREIFPAGLDLRVRVSKRPLIGYIEDAQVEDRVYRPGEKVEIRVPLRAYRGEVEEVSLTLELPKDLEAGRYTLMVRGGGMESLYGQEEVPTFKSLEEMWEYLSKKESNNQVVVEILKDWSEGAAVEGEMAEDEGSERESLFAGARMRSGQPRPSADVARGRAKEHGEKGKGAPSKGTSVKASASTYTDLFVDGRVTKTISVER